jgi:hypothetical protein
MRSLLRRNEKYLPKNKTSSRVNGWKNVYDERRKRAKKKKKEEE